MKHILQLCFACALLFSATSAQAQITLTSDILQNLLNTSTDNTLYEFDAATDASAIAAASGANQVWDFSSFVVADSFSITETYMTLPQDIEGISNFPDSDFAVKIESDTVSTELGEDAAFYAIHSFENDVWTLDGLISVGDVDMNDTTDVLVNIYDPASLVIPFPVEYEDTWTDSTSSSSIVNGIPIPFSFTEKAVSTVDGWGTLITPTATVQALRIKTEFFEIDPFTGLEVFSHTDIEFVSQELVTASLFVNDLGIVEDVAYSVPVQPMQLSTDSDDELPDGFRLEQNFPNPFNPSTQIAYTLPAATQVTLTVFTITGQEVEVLVEGTQNAGTYELIFDATNLASGLYFYRLQTANRVETRLMSLIK